jgi:hypothetical protein
MKKEDENIVKEAVKTLNQELTKARDYKSPKRRIGLVWQADGNAAVIDIEDIEVFYGDMTSMHIKAKLLHIINDPFHVEIHHIIEAFLLNNLDSVLDK